MKYIILIPLALILFITTPYAQTVDYSHVPKTVQATPYNGEFIFIDGKESQAVYKGLEGQVLMDFENNEYTILKYTPTLNIRQDVFELKNNKTLAISEMYLGALRDYYLIEGLEKAKELIAQISFNPQIEAEKIIHGFNGEQISLHQGQSIHVSDIAFGLFGLSKMPMFAFELENKAIVRVSSYRLSKNRNDLLDALLWDSEFSFSIGGSNNVGAKLVTKREVKRARETKAKADVAKRKATADAKAKAAAQAAKKASGNENANSGAEGFDFEENGKVLRAIQKRAFPKDLSKSGRVVFNICINREGRVIYAKYNRLKSTLTDKSAISDALSAMKKTTFATDNSAPSKECGQWTMSFKALDD